MSFFRKLFGGKKKETKGPNPRSIEVNALLTLRTTEQLLREESKALETNIKKKLAVVKKNVIRNKQDALNAIKRKNCYERQLSRNDDLLSIIIQQNVVFENILNTNNIMVDATSRHIDDIHNMIDDMATLNDLTQKISEAFFNPISSDTDIDEEELPKELNELELEYLDEQVMNSDLVQATNYPIPVEPTFSASEQIKKNP